LTCTSWSFGLKRHIGNASVKTQYVDQDLDCYTKDGENEDKQVAVRLLKGPFINLERRNQVPAPLVA